MPESAKQRLINNIRRKALRAAKASSEARVQLEEVADALHEQQDDEEETSKAPPEEEQELEEGEVDPEAIPYKDWLNLASVAGVTVSQLKARRGLDPYSCTIVVERVKPNIYHGKPVPVGLIPGLRFTFPFNLTQIEQEIASLYGGEQFMLRLRSNFGKTIRTIPLTIAMPPKNFSGGEEEEEEEAEPEDNGSSSGVRELKQKVEEEELTTELLRRRRQRLEAQQEVDQLEPTEEEETAEAPTEFDVSQEVQRRVQEAREELIQEYEVKAEIQRLRDEVRNAKKDDGGGNMQLIVTAMQTQTNAMLEGLKMVVQNVADQVKDMQRSGQAQAEIMARAQTVSGEAQAKIMQAMMDAKGGQVELVMKLLGDKRERDDMTIDRITNLIMTGMELKAGLAEGKEGGGGGGDDWLNVALKSLTDLITKKTLADTSIPALPGPQQPAVDVEAQKKFIEAEAQKAAAKVVAKAKQEALRRAAAKKAQAVTAAGAPTPATPALPAVPATPVAPVAPTAPVAEEGDAVEVPEDAEEGDTLEVEESPHSSDPNARRRALLSRVLSIVLSEMEDMPLESEAIEFALTSMPADWRRKIAVTDNALEFMEFFKPYADIALVEQIKNKAKASETQKKWLMQQAGILRGAVQEAEEEAKNAGGGA